MRHLRGNPPAVMNQPRITELRPHAVPSILSCNFSDIVAYAMKLHRAGMDIERRVLRPVVRATRMADAARVDEMEVVGTEPHAARIQARHAAVPVDGPYLRDVGMPEETDADRGIETRHDVALLDIVFGATQPHHGIAQAGMDEEKIGWEDQVGRQGMEKRF